MKIRNIIIEAIVSIICIGLIVTIFIWQKNKNNNITNEVGQISFKVIFKDDELVIDDIIKFFENDNLFDLLNDKYELVYDENIYGHTIYSINGYATDFTTDYFSIMINGTYATTGIDGIELIDGEVIEFVWQEINW